MQRFEQLQREEQVLQQNAMQVALATVVELPLMDFQERVRNEMEANEALEERGADDADDDERTTDEQNTEEDAPSDTDSPADDTERLPDEAADYLTADDIPDYLLRQQSQREEREYQFADAATSYDDLYRQMGEYDLTDEQRAVMEYLIGSLDSDGYLRKSDDVIADELAIYEGIDTTPEEVARLVSILQSFDPRGIGTRNLQECLLVQLDDPDFHSPHKALARRLLSEHFKDFADHHWDVLMRRLQVSREELDAAIRLLTRLNPRPGSALGETATEAAPSVVPDFLVSVRDGIVSLSLARGELPELRVSRAFRDTLKEYGPHREHLNKTQQDEYVYARKKVSDAQFFIQLVQRRQRTLLSVMRSIVQIQNDFFVNDDDEALLLPMTLKDVATRAGSDISTVSRVVNGKYVQTQWGVYPLKHFFSYQFTSESGEELSSRQARALLKEIIEAEDKSNPLTDDKLSAEMKRRNLPISRRTVAKYREMMGIPPARLRR